MNRQLQIPESQIKGLQYLLGLNEDIFSRLIERLSKVPPTVTYSKLSLDLAKLLNVTQEDVLNLLGTIIALHELSQVDLVLPEQLAIDVAESLGETNDLSQENKRLIQSRLESVLVKSDSLGVIAKARNVLTDNQRTFLDCRILSDIRAVFTSSPENEPGAAVILHTLKLVYYQNYKKEEFFVTLDTEDLKSLRAALERAEKKTSSLSDLVKKSGLDFIDLAEE